MNDKETAEFKKLSTRWASGARMSKRQMLRALELKRRSEHDETEAFVKACAARHEVKA